MQTTTTGSEQERRCQFPDSPLTCGSNRRQIADTGNVGIPSGLNGNHHHLIDGHSSPSIGSPVATINPLKKII